MAIPLDEPFPASSPAAAPLPVRVMVAYGVMNVGVSFLSTMFVVMYLKFATDRLGVSMFSMGAIFFVGKIWNAIADPIVGSWCDRTRSRAGRRRTWLLGSAFPLAWFTWMIWAPPGALAGAPLVAWIAISVFGFNSAMTAFQVPHAALGAEITHHPPSRNHVFAVKFALQMVGLFAAFWIGVPIVDHAETARAGARWFGVLAGIGSALLIALPLPFLPKERQDYQGRGGVSILRALGDVAKNPEARLLLFVFFIEALGLGGLSVLMPFVTQYVMHRPDLTQAMLSLYVVAGVAGVPIWVRLTRRFEKRKLWLFAMGMGGVGFGALLGLGENRWPLMTVAMLIAGTAQACANSIGHSLKADVIDLDELRTGERKEGAYFAAWSFVNKLGNAILASAAGWALGLAGYVPNVAQTPLVVHTMVFLLGGMPLLGFVIGSFAFARFPLSEVEHARIRRELDARASEHPSAVARTAAR
jgi:GPH family glycoside/pentoside/hexuronide:cation symporter